MAFRDDQVKFDGSPSRGGAIDLANNEMNLVWKQAVRLSLKRSVNSARLIINKDKQLSSQKREQLIVVNQTYVSLWVKFSLCCVTSKKNTIRSYSRK